MRRSLGALLACGLVAAASAADAPAPMRDAGRMWRERLDNAPQLAVSAAFDERGRLWLARAAGQQVTVARSDDLGATFSSPVGVVATPERVSADGENRPKIALGGGNVYVSWTQPLPQPFAGHIRFAFSDDDGRSFSTPITVNSHAAPTSHRFDALLADAAGGVTLVWLDKRDGLAAEQAGATYKGAAVYYARSNDGGRHFEPNRKLADHSCECCRVGIAADRDGMPVAFWRHIFEGGVRDFALARLDEPARRATEDGWRIDACPHHGGDVAVDARGSRHVVWFTGAEGKAGLYYRRVDGERSTAPLAFGDLDAQPGHPAVLARGERVIVAWREFDGRRNLVRVMTSSDRGESWSAPAASATTAGAADYPLLIAGRGRAWLAWNTAAEGFRLFDLGAAQ